MERKKPARDKTFWEKLDKPHALIFFLVPIILISLPILHPIGIPFPIDEYTLKSWNKINSLPEGSVVVVESIAWPEMWDVCGPSLIALNKVFWSQNYKVIYYCLEPRGISVPMIKSIIDAHPESFGAEYGEDYVVFGLVAGMEIGMASFASDIRKTASIDYYGNPIDTLPMMKDINSAKDVDLVISSYLYATQSDWIARQWGEAYGVPIIMVTVWPTVASALPYYPKYVVGFIPDVAGGASLERLSGFHGLATSFTDASSVGGLIVLACLLAGNIVMIGLKLTKKEERKSGVS